MSEVEFSFDVTHLFGRELIVENDHSHFAFSLLLGQNILFDFLEFALSYVRNPTGCVESLCESAHGNSSCRIGQELQFVEILPRLFLVLFLRDEAHQHGRFGFHLGDDKFFHR